MPNDTKQMCEKGCEGVYDQYAEMLYDRYKQITVSAVNARSL